MYAKVPNEVWEHDVRILREASPSQSEVPRYFLQSTERKRMGSMHASYEALQEFGFAFFRKDMKTVEKFRRIVEQNYLRDVVEYELVTRLYDPLLRLKTGEIRGEEVIKKYPSEATP